MPLDDKLNLLSTESRFFVVNFLVETIFSDVLQILCRVRVFLVFLRDVL